MQEKAATGADRDVSGPNPTVFWLGAGFSRCVTNGSLPLMVDFFTELKASDHPDLNRFLCEAFGSARDANVEHAIALLDQFRAPPASGPALDILISRQDPRKVRSQLGTYCFDRLKRAPWDIDHWAVNLLAQADQHDTVITVNYDTLAESILSHKCDATHGVDPDCYHCRMCALLDGNAISSATPASKLEHQQIVLKVHGSVAWRICRNPTCPCANRIAPDRHCRPAGSRACVGCGSETEPVIVLPTTQKLFDEYPGISRMWNAAITALTHAREIVIFGFSFPESDLFIRHAFRRALHCNRVLKTITVIDVTPVTVCERMQALLPRERVINFRLLAVPRDQSVPNWIRRAA